MGFRIQVLKMGECEVAGPEVFWMSRWNDWVKLVFWMVVVRGHGKTAIINTGPPADLGTLNQRWGEAFGERGKLARSEGERPVAALASLGIRPEDVDYVLVTPLQAYATGNLHLFPNARICVSKRGWIEDFHAEKFPMHVPRELRIPDEPLRYLTFEGHAKLRLLEDEDEVMPGLRAFWVGVHHRSSMCYVVDTPAGRVAITDCVFRYENIEAMVPLGIQESLDEFHLACARIGRESDIVVPLYEPEVTTRHPGGRIG